MFNLQAVPRTVWLDKLGKRLLQWPVEELETLRGGRVDLCNKLLEGGSKIEVVGVTASQVIAPLYIRYKRSSAINPYMNRFKCS